MRNSTNTGKKHSGGASGHRWLRAVTGDFATGKPIYEPALLRGDC